MQDADEGVDLTPRKPGPERGPDGLPTPVVGPWVEEKHKLLRAYLGFQSAVRPQWLNDHRQNGATFVDLFCGAGLARIEDTSTYVDGSAIVAWKCSVEDGAPFSSILIADSDEALRAACAERLRTAGAPVVELCGTALDAARSLPDHISLYGLHVAFLDPFNLGELDIQLIQELSKFKHMDVLAHVSAMDLFRNFPLELKGTRSEFDTFAPGWRDKIAPGATDEEGRRAVLDHWKALVQATGLSALPEWRQVRNTVNRDLYYLLLIAKAELATKFWRLVRKYESPQTGFGF